MNKRLIEQVVCTYIYIFIDVRAVIINMDGWEVVGRKKSNNNRDGKCAAKQI